MCVMLATLNLLMQMFSCVLLISNSMVSRAFEKTINREFFNDFKIHSSSGLMQYSLYKKKLNRFEIALNFAKQLLVSSF